LSFYLIFVKIKINMPESFEQHFAQRKEEQKSPEKIRGEILDFLLEMEKIHGIKIKDADYIHSQPNGTLAGRVLLSDGRVVLFQGDKLLERIGEEEIKDAENIHSQPDGTLAGKVLLSDLMADGCLFKEISF